MFGGVRYGLMGSKIGPIGVNSGVGGGVDMSSNYMTQDDIQAGLTGMMGNGIPGMVGGGGITGGGAALAQSRTPGGGGGSWYGG